MTNQQAPKTRPISEDRQIASLFPTRFLKPAQLIAWKVTQIVVTISRMIEEEVQPKPNQTEWKPVLYFNTKNGTEHPQGYLLSAKVDAESLTSATGAAAVGDLTGKRIRIVLDEYRNQTVLRIDPEPVTREDPQPEPEPEPEAFTDSAAGEESSP